MWWWSFIFCVVVDKEVVSFFFNFLLLGLLLLCCCGSSECDFNESGSLGRNLRLHPVVGVMAVCDQVVDIWNGAPMTTVSEEAAHR